MQAQLEIRLQMARQFVQSGQTSEAEAIFRQVLAVDPDNVNAGSGLAALYTGQNKYELAIEILEETCKKNPDNSAALIRLAAVYKDWGKFAEAKACYRRAIPLDAVSAPRNVLSLATSGKYSEYDDDVRLMEEAHRKSAANSNGRRHIAFALGKVFDDLQSYEKAFEYFREGNRIAAMGNTSPIEETKKTFQGIKDLIDREFIDRRAGAGISDDMPIFVTGMPRSGTTLVEQILASHPEVHGGGELEKLSALVAGISYSPGSSVPDDLNALGPGVFREKAGHYINELGKLACGKRHVTDKSISSYIYLGLIKIMLPNAKVILCKRDPRDVGLSIFQTDLGQSYPWAYNLEWIGEFCGLFDELTDHWNSCLPDQIHKVQYEDLTMDPERHIRALLKHCNLEFDPACLAFHATDRVVATSSSAQVRQPMYRGSVGRWKNYAKDLGPLISALGRS